jgi:hypothetical protein
MELPHRFPFRWIDRSEAGSARLTLSSGSVWTRNGAPLPTAFCAEIVAQAAARLLDGAAVGLQPRWLAGIERLEMHGELRGGDELEVKVRPEAKYGPIVRITGEIYRRSERVCEAVLLLA